MRDIVRIAETLFRMKYGVFALLCGVAFLMQLALAGLHILRLDPGWFGLIFFSVYQLFGLSLLLEPDQPRSPCVRLKAFGIIFAINIASLFFFSINSILLFIVLKPYFFSHGSVWGHVLLPICAGALWMFYLWALPLLTALKIRSLQAPFELVATIKLVRNSMALRQLLPAGLILLSPICLILFIPIIPAFLVWEGASYVVQELYFQKLLLSVGFALVLFVEAAVGCAMIPSNPLTKNILRMRSKK